MNEVNGPMNEMSKMTDELKKTPEQAFILMLKERMDQLEDELLLLERRFQSQFHRIEIQTTQSKADILNLIFQNRSHVQPVFAAWSWTQYEDQLFLTMVMTTQTKVSEHYFTHLPGKYTPIPDLYTFVQYFQTYFHDEDEGDTSYSYEYWHRYFGALFGWIDVEWDTKPFLSSQNYNGDSTLQQKLRKWVFQNPSWTEILRIFY